MEDVSDCSHLYFYFSSCSHFSSFSYLSSFFHLYSSSYFTSFSYLYSFSCLYSFLVIFLLLLTLSSAVIPPAVWFLPQPMAVVSWPTYFSLASDALRVLKYYCQSYFYSCSYSCCYYCSYSRRQTRRSDEPTESDRLRQPDEGDVVVVR